MSFDTLGLSTELLSTVTEQGYSKPTPIQDKAIPLILKGRDILAGAQTGTGKTAGFTLPLLHRLMESRRPSEAAAKNKKKKKSRPIRALILVPTRELALQVKENVDTYSKKLPLHSTVVLGGVKIKPQIMQLRRGVDILVATPGRLLDHLNQRTVDLSSVETLVLDEADCMLDMGFIHDIRKIISALPKKRQNLLFSATFSKAVKSLADSFLHSPVVIEIGRRNNTSDCVKQTIYSVDRESKRELLYHLICSLKWEQVLVFTRTKSRANRLTEQLEKDGIPSAAIHGDKKQAARIRSLARFKAGKTRVLVATDIAARGIDIDQLPYVVNFELPTVPEDYIHRIGRTGRAGNKGEAISLVCVDEHRLLQDIESLIELKLPKVVEPGFEPDPSIKPKPFRPKRMQKFRKSRGQRNRSRRHSKR